MGPGPRVKPAPLDGPWVEMDASSFLPPVPQILRKVLQGCRGSMLGTMALAACQFMEEPGMEVQVRESKHPYNNNTSFEVWPAHVAGRPDREGRQGFIIVHSGRSPWAALAEKGLP